MLVLTRKVGERVHIGDNIVVTVTDIDRGRVRLGLEAPRDVPIHREELLPHARNPGTVSAVPAAPEGTSPPVDGVRV